MRDTGAYMVKTKYDYLRDRIPKPIVRLRRMIDNSMTGIQEDDSAIDTCVVCGNAQLSALLHPQSDRDMFTCHFCNLDWHAMCAMELYDQCGDDMLEEELCGAGLSKCEIPRCSPLWSKVHTVCPFC